MPAPDWQPLLAALDSVAKQFETWRDEGHIRREQADAIAAEYATLRRDWEAAATRFEAIPAPWAKAYTHPDTDDPLALRERRLAFLAGEVRRQAEAGRITLSQEHQLAANVRARLAFARQKMADADEPILEATAAPPPGRPLLEILLDPRSIQWLLAVGGVLMVLGIVIYLYSVGVFENPLVIAGILGGTNIFALAAGGHLLVRTRFRLAGKALTLLACLILPLNLWFASAQSLVTAETLDPQSPGHELLRATWVRSVGEGPTADTLARAGNGNLWLPAAVICAFYAAACWLLADAAFVPVFMGGVTLAVLLGLAKADRFWEITAPATFLVAFGLAGIHAERAFAPGKGTYRRDGFGLAFFFSGVALLTAGLALVFGAQVVGDWLYRPFFEGVYARFDPPFNRPPWLVATPDGLRWAALLVGAGVYACLYADIVVRRTGVYVLFAALGVLWAEVLIVESLGLNVGPELVLATLAGTALAANLFQMTGRDMAGRVPRYLPVAAAVLSFVPVGVGVFLHVLALAAGESVRSENWAFVAAMALSALACRLGASLNAEKQPALAWMFLFGAGASILVGMAAALNVAGLHEWAQRATLVMLVPVAYLTAAHLRPNTPLAGALKAAAHTGTAVMLVCSLYSTVDVAVGGTYGPRAGELLNLALAGFFAEAAIFYILAAVLHGQRVGVYMATLCASAALWQALQFLRVPPEWYTGIFALAGLALLFVYRLTPQPGDRPLGVASAAFACGNGLLTAAAAACGLIVGTSLAASVTLEYANIDWRPVVNCAAVAVVSLAAAVVVADSAWRRWYVVLAVLEGLLALLAVGRLLPLEPWQKVEIFLVVAGVVVLAISLAAWQRESEAHSESVGFGLFFGSALIALPLAVAAGYWRGYEVRFSGPDEAALLAAGVGLLLVGNMLRLKSPSLIGAALLAWNVLTLPLFGRKLLEQLPTIGVVLAVGGGVIFGGGLLLAVFRDALLAMPERIKQRKGMFRVLNWR